MEDLINDGFITVLKGSEIENMLRIGHINRFLLQNLYKQIKVKPDCFYIIVEQRADYERIQSFLSVEFGEIMLSELGEILYWKF